MAAFMLVSSWCHMKVPAPVFTMRFLVFTEPMRPGSRIFLNFLSAILYILSLEKSAIIILLYHFYIIQNQPLSERFPSEYQQKQPVDCHVQNGERRADFHKLQECEIAAASLFGVLDNDDIAGRAEDGQVTGDGTPRRQCHHPYSRRPGLHQHR